VSTGSYTSEEMRSSLKRNASSVRDLTVDVPGDEVSGQPVKVSFFGAIGFGRYALPGTTSDGVLR
jgi:hypothetical protein